MRERVRPELEIRRPEPEDYPLVVRVIDDWWGRRQVPGILGRLWFEHFAGTSRVAITPDGRLAGFLVAFVSQDRPAEMVLVAVGVDPNLRRLGVGRRLAEGLLADARSHGAARLITTVFPGDPAAVAFLRNIGFQLVEELGMRRLYGIPALADHEWGREDRAVLVREVEPA